MAVDPTYPFYPIACMLSAVMLFLVLLTGFIRQSWNLGVASLCFWLFLENLTAAINAIIWADDADIKLYVYCDIVSHVQLVSSVVKPMATLIITRRLYLIASLQSVDLPDKAEKRKNSAIEWTLGLVIPCIVAGPLYYIVQELRFKVEEGFGCTNSSDGSVLDILLLSSWTTVPPVVSIILYYPRVARIFYRQTRDVNRFLQSNDSVSRTNYIRIIILASIDIMLTLPFGAVTIILAATSQLSAGFGFPIYRGWTYDHTDWEPESIPYTELGARGPSYVARTYFSLWSSPLLAFTIFGLFGVTSEARASYWHIIRTICGRFAWKPMSRTGSTRSSLGELEFGDRPMDLEIEPHPSDIDPNVRMEERTEGISSKIACAAPTESKASSEMGITEEPKERR